MHLKMIYKYSFNRALHKLLVYVATAFLCFVVFALLLVSIFAWRFVRQGRTAVDACLNGGIEQAGMISIDTFGFEYEEAVDAFVQESSKMKEIRGIGDGSIGGRGTEGLEELWEQQKQLQNTDPSSLWGYYMNQEAIGMYNIQLQEGKMPDEYELNEDIELYYLGSNYKDIPIGTKYELWEGHTIYVAGILEAGTKLISEDICLDDVIVDARYVENMDNQILEVSTNIYSARLIYTVTEGYTVKDVETKLRTLAEKHGLKMRFGVLEDILDEKERQHSYIFDTIRKMLIAITITAFFLLLCTQFAEMLDDMNYFGIFYANGASTRDLISILLGENLIKVIVSYILAVIAVYYAIKHEWSLFQPGIEKWEKAMEIYCGQTIGPAFIIGVMLALFATVIPIIWFRKKSPTELMRGYDV